MTKPVPLENEARPEFITRCLKELGEDKLTECYDCWDQSRTIVTDIQSPAEVMGAGSATQVTTEKSEEVITSGPLYDAVQKTAYVNPFGVAKEPIIDEVFITDNNTTVSANEIVRMILAKSMAGFDSERIHKEANNSVMDVAKSIEGSTQSREELMVGGQIGMSISKVVEPPYPPELLGMFLEVSETHFRCVKTKVTDSIGREFEIIPVVNVRSSFLDEEEEDEEGEGEATTNVSPSLNALLQSMQNAKQLHGQILNGGNKLKPRVSALDTLKQRTQMSKAAKDPMGREIPKDYHPDAIQEEVTEVAQFIEDCNEIVGFDGVLERAGMDHEGIGWGAIEVIRGQDMKIKRISHIPAQRVRVLRGWRGYVEILSGGPSGSNTGGQYIYYQNFGDKVLSKKRVHPSTNVPVPYNPREDGDLGGKGCQWNLIDRMTGEATDDWNRAANEILWIPKHHSNTVYYGFSDVVPALGAVLANVHIRDYALQFFEHNCIPRYAIVIEGARLAEPVLKAITEYFGEHVKGKHHKTLIIPVPAVRGEVRVRFEKLAVDNLEAGFQETNKNNDQRILTAHGVSPAIIGIAEAANLGSGKGMSQAEIYKDRIVTPSQRRWSRILNQMFKLGLGIQLVAIKFNPLDIRDRQGEMQLYTGYQKAGIMTINQVRKRVGLGDPIEGGDRAFIILSGGIQFIDELTNMSGSMVEQAQQTVDGLTQQLQTHQATQKAHQQGHQLGFQEGQQAATQNAASNAGRSVGPVGTPAAQTNVAPALSGVTLPSLPPNVKPKRQPGASPGPQAIGAGGSPVNA